MSKNPDRKFIFFFILILSLFLILKFLYYPISKDKPDILNYNGEKCPSEYPIIYFPLDRTGAPYPSGGLCLSHCYTVNDEKKKVTIPIPDELGDPEYGPIPQPSLVYASEEHSGLCVPQDRKLQSKFQDLVYKNRNLLPIYETLFEEILRVFSAYSAGFVLSAFLLYSYMKLPMLPLQIISSCSPLVYILLAFVFPGSQGRTAVTWLLRPSSFLVLTGIATMHMYRILKDIPRTSAGISILRVTLMSVWTYAPETLLFPLFGLLLDFTCLLVVFPLLLPIAEAGFVNHFKALELPFAVEFISISIVWYFLQMSNTTMLFLTTIHLQNTFTNTTFPSKVALKTSLSDLVSSFGSVALASIFRFMLGSCRLVLTLLSLVLHFLPCASFLTGLRFLNYFSFSYFYPSISKAVSRRSEGFLKGLGNRRHASCFDTILPICNILSLAPASFAVLAIPGFRMDDFPFSRFASSFISLFAAFLGSRMVADWMAETVTTCISITEEREAQTSHRELQNGLGPDCSTLA